MGHQPMVRPQLRPQLNPGCRHQQHLHGQAPQLPQPQGPNGPVRLRIFGRSQEILLAEPRKAEALPKTSASGHDPGPRANGQ